MRYLHHVSVVEVSRDGDVLQPDATDQALRVFQQVVEQFSEDYNA